MSGTVMPGSGEYGFRSPYLLSPNRINAKKSCGPRTARGRAISSQNALKTGIDAKAEVIRTENRAHYDALIASFHARFLPETNKERQLVHDLIRAEWLSRRAMVAAANVINRGLDECPDHHPGQIYLERMDQICRSQRRINVATRDFARALRELNAIRAKKVRSRRLPAKDLTRNRLHSSFSPSAPVSSTPLNWNFMRIALGQINTTVGDIAGNVALITRLAHTAAERGAELAVFPELSITGYPPRDLVERRGFVERSEDGVQRLAEATAQLPLAIVAGYVGRSSETTGKQTTNSAVIVQGGRVLLRQTKMLLPTYDVFDEGRNFVPGRHQSIWALGTENLALTICEDSWNDKLFWTHRLYARDPVDELMQQGASLLISVNSSPYHLGKRELRREMFRSMVRRHRVPAIVVNQVGGNDQVVFDGSSFAMDADGNVIASASSFREDLIIADTAARTGDMHADLPHEPEAVYEALVLGTRDYIRKCGFAKVLIGLSGGIDSSLTAVVAVDAVGRENVRGVAMERLGIQFDIVPITPAYNEMLATLGPVFEGRAPDVAEENIQARLRGLTLMSLSNKFGAMVLTTGNKSEIAVGYCTLYGDMCGGLAVISDVPKTLVYELSRIANQRHAGAIPEYVFEKPPSAELRPDQKDSDSLPPYDVLDAILRLYVEDMRSPAEIAAELGVALDLVKDVARKVDRNEYKRQQAAPGLKVTSKAFGIGRRFPIAQKYFEGQ